MSLAVPDKDRLASSGQMSDIFNLNEGLKHGTQALKHLFLEHMEGYVKDLEKSTSPLSTLREVFEHGPQNDEAGRKRMKVVLKVLSIVRSGDPIRTRSMRQNLY